VRATLFVVIGIALAAGSAPAVAADGFVFEVAAPHFKITMPGFPALRMKTHPLHAGHPHLRYMASEGPYSLQIITPASAPGMTALECASATVRTLASRPGVPPPGEIVKARLDRNTFVALYSARMPGFMQLHAHLLSAAGGTHCIEVHASKIATSADDIAPWFEEFRKARIESDASPSLPEATR
jgi:hypothetical protein